MLKLIPKIKKIFPLIGLFILFQLLCSGCSIKSIALNSVGDALSSSGDVFTSDNDPDLIKDSLPFALKMYESVLDGVPENKPLIAATSKAFTMYAYAFLQLEAEKIDKNDFEKAKFLRYRAYSLYIRAKDYALRGLELNHPGFIKSLKNSQGTENKDYKEASYGNWKEAIKKTNKDDISLLYWCGASWTAALTVAKDNLELIAEMPIGVTMMERVLELDESFDEGAAHDYFISYYGGISAAMGGNETKAREHFKRAIELSKGSKAGPYISLATSVCISKQNKEEFKNLLNDALAIDVNKQKENRLANIIMQRKAKWLLDNIDDFFFEVQQETE